MTHITHMSHLSETGVDDNGLDDISACATGTFNKLNEKAGRLHPHMVLDFIT
jgi:hypothetical protein